MKEFRSKRLRVWENINRTMQEFKVLLLGYRSYTALLTQTGTDAPVAIVLENNIGNIVWSRVSDGEYNGTLNSAFTSNKTYYSITMTSGGGLDVGQFVQNTTQSDYISIATWSNNIFFDGLLANTPIEIRVYN